MSRKVNWTQNMKQTLMDNYENYTYKELAEMINLKYNVNISQNAIRKAYERYKLPVLDIPKNAPKILLFDLETTPIVAYTWGLYDQNIGLNQVLEESTVLSWCAKWYGEDEVMYMDTSNQKNVRNDKKIIKALGKLIDEADYVVAHNLNSFDHKVFNARVISNNLKPPKPYKKFDTLKVARKHFKFMSNKLAHLTEKLGKKYKKSEHGKYPGFKMWSECLKGNKDAFKEMKEYNKLDVLSLEELFETILPWESAAIFDAYNKTEEPICTCGSNKFTKAKKPFSTGSYLYTMYTCKNCGASYRSSEKVSNRKSLMRKTTR